MELKLKSEPLTWKAQDFIFLGEAPHLKKIGYCQKNNKIDLFQVRGEARYFPSEGERGRARARPARWAGR